MREVSRSVLSKLVVPRDIELTQTSLETSISRSVLSKRVVARDIELTQTSLETSILKAR